MHRRSLLLLAVCLSSVVAAGCDVLSSLFSQGGSKGTVSLANDIQPILTARCAGCHSDGTSTAGGGIAIRLVEGRSRDTMLNQPSAINSSLTLVVPGNSAASLLFQKLASDTPPVGVRMPRNASPLEQAQIDLFATWIDEGALDN